MSIFFQLFSVKFPRKSIFRGVFGCFFWHNFLIQFSFSFFFHSSEIRSLLNVTAKKLNYHNWKSVNFWCHKNSPCHNSYQSFVIAWKLDQPRHCSFWWIIVRWYRWVKHWLKFMRKIVAKMVSSTYIMHHKKSSDNEATMWTATLQRRKREWWTWNHHHVQSISCTASFFLNSNRIIYFCSFKFHNLPDICGSKFSWRFKSITFFKFKSLFVILLLSVSNLNDITQIQENNNQSKNNHQWSKVKGDENNNNNNKTIRMSWKPPYRQQKTKKSDKTNLINN